jgi:bifunctional NMN adenylyltransferase/nudix hydrolase
MKKYRHGLAVMRAQPFHSGHRSLVDKMMEDCSYITIILGSIAEKRTLNNPFTFEERRTMIVNVYPERKNVNIFGLADIPNDDDWCDYVIDSVEKKSSVFGKINAYYCGDNENGSFYMNRLKIEKLDRTLQQGCRNISATEIREMILKQNETWKYYVPLCNVSLIENLLPLLLQGFSK